MPSIIYAVIGNMKELYVKLKKYTPLSIKLSSPVLSFRVAASVMGSYLLLKED